MAAAHSLPEPMTAWSFPDCSVGQHPAESKLHALKSITSELTLLRENPDTDRAEKALDGFHHTYTLPFADLVVPVEHNSPAGGLTSVSPDKMKHWLYTKLGLDPFSFCCVGCFFFPCRVERPKHELSHCLYTYMQRCPCSIRAAVERIKSETEQGNIVSRGTFCSLAMLR